MSDPIRYELGYMGAGTLRRDLKGWLTDYHSYSVLMAENARLRAHLNECVECLKAMTARPGAKWSEVELSPKHLEPEAWALWRDKLVAKVIP
jgi:hypothetical protein